MRKITLFFLLTIFVVYLAAEKVASFSNHINPTHILIDNHQLYIVDGPTINIYSLGDFKLQKTFGKRGEGPQEFKMDNAYSKGLLVHLAPNHIVVNSQNRFSLFTKKGDFIKQINASSGYNFKPVGERFVGHGILAEGKTRLSAIGIYDPQLKNIEIVLKKQTHWIQDSQGKIKHLESTPRQSIVKDNKIFVTGLETDFIIDIFDLNGKKLHSIKKNYEWVKFTEHHANKVLNWFKTNPRTGANFAEFYKAIIFPEYFPAIRDFSVSYGKVYVRTYREKDKKTEFLVFYSDGKYIKTVYLPLVESNLVGAFPYYYNDKCPFAIQNDKLYRLIESDEEEGTWELHVTGIK